MGTITLPNFRTTSDITGRVRLKDGGLAIDWSGLADIKAWLYSDAQRAIAGRCDVSISEADSTKLVCEYSASKPQYPGVNRLIVQARYNGRTKTYDKPVFNFVPRTADQAGTQITMDDPEVDVEIVVEDVSSSILDNIIAAALDAAARAEAAAQEAEHMVDIHTGPAGKSPYKGENGNWFEWDEESGQYVDTGVQAKGETGDTPDISIGTVTTVEPGEPAAASMTGTPEAPVLNLSIPKGLVGATPNFTVGTVTTGQPGTPVVITITGTAEAPVLNVQIPQGMKGDTGVSADYPITIHNGLDSDATDEALAAFQGKVLDGKISQLQQEVTRNFQLVWDSLGAAAFWGGKPDIDFTGNTVPVSLNLVNCTTNNYAGSVTKGEPYSATISPEGNRILKNVSCTMDGIEQSVVNGVISIAVVTGAIVISAEGVGLDDVAYETLTYRQIFETNNALGISPGFDNGSYSPLNVGAGEPTISTEDADTGQYSLKCFGESSQQIRTAGTFTDRGFVACRVKVTSWTSGYCGAQYASLNCGANNVTDGWETKVIYRSGTSPASAVFVGSYSSANLNGYVDSPVFVKSSIFQGLPTVDTFRELYNTYISIKQL